MTKGEIESGVAEAFRLALGHEVARGATRASEPDWDSLKHMQLIFLMEEKFGMQFSEEEIASLASFQEFVDRLQKRYES